MREQVCGCLNLKGLRAWFPSKVIARALKENFIIVRYKVAPENVIIGNSDTQVVFKEKDIIERTIYRK